MIIRILKYIGLQVQITRAFFNKSSYFRPINPNGSFLSDSEIKMRGSSLELELLLNLFQVEKIEGTLTRIGGTGDGSYMIAKQDFANCLLLSGGISDNNDFEFELANLGIRCIQFDGSITEPPKKHQNLAFYPQYLGQRSNQVSLDEMLRLGEAHFEHKFSSRILKLDIEGAEWSFLDNENLSQFNQIVLELHGLSDIFSKNKSGSMQYLVKHLVEYFFLVYVNGNNCCGFVEIGGTPIPNVIEVTFVNRKNFQSAGVNLEMISPIANIPNLPPLNLWGLRNR